MQQEEASTSRPTAPVPRPATAQILNVPSLYSHTHTSIQQPVRVVYFFYVDRHIGPKVIIIGHMIMDLVSLWAIFLLSYGVMVEALRLPGYRDSWDPLKRIVYDPYWQMYSSIDDDIKSGVFDACGNATDLDNIYGECRHKSGIIMFICAVYSLLTAILLLNLLIAMFNTTYSRMQDNSWGLWNYYRYKLVYDYFERPILVPPLIIFSHIWLCANYYREWRNGTRPRHDFSTYKPYNFDFTVPYKAEDRQLTAFERLGMEKVMRQEERKQDKSDSSSSPDSVVELRQQLNEHRTRTSLLSSNKRSK